MNPLDLMSGFFSSIFSGIAQLRQLGQPQEAGGDEAYRLELERRIAEAEKAAKEEEERRKQMLMIVGIVVVVIVVIILLVALRKK